jgi:hypothetical protein
MAVAPGVGAAANVALTVVSLLTVRVQLAVPLQPPPLHPAKVEPAAVAAVSITLVPAVTVAAQVLPHRIPVGSLDTDPAPARTTVRVALVGATAVAVPVTVRETESPLALKVTLLAKVPAAVERRRTTTGWLAPGASENEPPDTIANGDPTLAEPARLAVVAFLTVNEISTAAPTAVVPKSTAVVGLTVMSAHAGALTDTEHWLSRPPRSTAVMVTKYGTLAVRPAKRYDRASPLPGVDVGEAMKAYEELGQVGGDVARYTRYPSRSESGVPSALIVGALQLTLSEAASTRAPLMRSAAETNTTAVNRVIRMARPSRVTASMVERGVRPMCRGRTERKRGARRRGASKVRRMQAKSD